MNEQLKDSCYLGTSLNHSSPLLLENSAFKNMSVPALLILPHAEGNTYISISSLPCAINKGPCIKFDPRLHFDNEESLTVGQ